MDNKTKTRVPPPPRAREDAPITTRLQVAPPTLEETPSNLIMPAEGWADLNFKVTHDFRKQFRIEAALRGMSNKSLLEAALKLYLENFPVRRQ